MRRCGDEHPMRPCSLRGRCYVPQRPAGPNGSPKTGVFDGCLVTILGMCNSFNYAIFMGFFPKNGSLDFRAAPESACQRSFQLWNPLLTAILYSMSCELLPEHHFLPPSTTENAGYEVRS